MNRKKLLRVALVATVIGLIVVGLQQTSFEELHSAMQAWLAPMGIWAPVVFTLIFVSNTVGMPVSWLSTIAGLLFGMQIGLLVAIAGTLCSGIVTFVGARTLLASWAKDLQGDPRLDLINKLIARRGMVILPLIRIPPVSHYTTVNILLSLTAVRLPTFMITSVIGMLPICFFYVMSGNAVANIMAGGSIDTFTIVSIIIATIAVIVLTWIIYKDVKAIRREEALAAQ